MSAAPRLRVVAGRQRGAGVTLAPGSTRVLGRDLGADIVLREPGLAARAVGLRVDEDGRRVRLESLVDGVSVDGEPLPAGDAATLVPGATIAIGSLALVLEAADVAASPDGAVGDVAGERGGSSGDASAGGDADVAARQARGAADGFAGADAVPDAPGAEDDPFDIDLTTAASGASGTPAAADPPAAPDRAASAGSPRRRSPLVTLGLVATIVCVALAGWLRFGGDGVAGGPSLAARLEAAFPALALERRTGRPGVVRGFVADRGESIRLERWLAAQPERASSAVLVDTELAERVEDVLRISEVEATVRSLAAGAAVVDVSVADAEALEQIETRVREDVPQLVALTLENTPPPPVEKATPADPGKRVELVVATEPAYVVTRDRSRYFVGSLLPSGHRIAAIEEGTLHLEKGDVRTELKF